MVAIDALKKVSKSINQLDLVFKYDSRGMYTIS